MYLIKNKSMRGVEHLTLGAAMRKSRGGLEGYKVGITSHRDKSELSLAKLKLNLAIIYSV